MLKFTGLDDLRHSHLYPRTADDLDATKRGLDANFSTRLRLHERAPRAVIDAAVTLMEFLRDAARPKIHDHEALAVAALRYLFGEDDAIPDQVEFTGYLDDSIILDAVIAEIALVPRTPVEPPRSVEAPPATMPAASEPRETSAPVPAPEPVRIPSEAARSEPPVPGHAPAEAAPAPVRKSTAGPVGARRVPVGRSASSARRASPAKPGKKAPAAKPGRKAPAAKSTSAKKTSKPGKPARAQGSSVGLGAASRKPASRRPGAKASRTSGSARPAASRSARPRRGRRS